ncbi:MAG: ABC transporter ATP-binding protein [Bdellovibrionales bacterium]|nr:ABC transporter ATP-binding protein [Bdellovibrionales bacterium]
MSLEILSLTEVYKEYRSGEKSVRALDTVSLSLGQGDICAVTGPSGSGKTTLLALAAGLEPPTSGAVVVAGQNLADLDEDERALLRRDHTGFIFQDFQLIPTLTALENVSLPGELRRDPEAKARASELLDTVGLSARSSHFPSELSGGEQQRVAIARAFVNRPQILFADEPTGSLDGETSEQICDLLLNLNLTLGTTLLLVTHDPHLAARAPLQLDMTVRPLKLTVQMAT